MTRLTRLLFGFALLLIVPAPALFSRVIQISAVDVLHYRIELELKPDPAGISAETGIEFEISSGATRELSLDLAGMTVDGVSMDRREVEYARVGDKLNIALPREYRTGERGSVVVRYHGAPLDGLYLRKNKFGDASAFADNWPNRAHYWFPSIDHPSDKATVDFFVIAPDRFDVVANGVLKERTSKQDGRRLTHWSESKPIPTYCMVFGAAEFTVLNPGSAKGIPLEYYVYPKDREPGLRSYRRAPEMLALFSELIGDYPYEKLALVESSTRFGGMENATAIFFDEKAYGGPESLETTVAHEIAHQWFGDSVTEADWHDLWLSEGFATYFGHLFFERADGPASLTSAMQKDKSEYLAAYAKDPRPIFDPAITNLFALLNANNYQKGSWVLHMLRQSMGDKAFFEGIRDYYRKYRDRNASTADFQRVMQGHSNRPLEGFFRQWIYEPGFPVLEVGWTFDKPSRRLHFDVAQVQSKTVFQFPLELEIRIGDRVRRERIEISDREASFTVKTDREPSSVILDPESTVLMVWTVRGQQSGIQPGGNGGGTSDD